MKESLLLFLVLISVVVASSPDILCSCEAVWNSTAGRYECALHVSWEALTKGSDYWVGIYRQSTPIFPPTCPTLYAFSPLKLHALSVDGSAIVDAGITGIYQKEQLKCLLWKGEYMPANPNCNYYFAYSSFSFTGNPLPFISPTALRRPTPTEYRRPTPTEYRRPTPTEYRRPTPRPADFRPTYPVPPQSSSSRSPNFLVIVIPLIIGFVLFFAVCMFCLLRKKGDKKTRNDSYAPVTEGEEMSDVSSAQVSYVPQPTYMQSNMAQTYAVGGQPQMMMMSNSGVPMPPQYVMSNNPYASVQMVYAMPQQGFAGNQPVYIATNPAQAYYQPVPQQSTPQTQQ